MNAAKVNAEPSITTSSPERHVRILKISTCQNLSLSGEITYQIAVDDQGCLLLRVYA